MMDRHTFLQQLRALLADTSAEEREEAIRYYEEYFDEAGPEQEQAVLAELGSPAKVAAILRANVPGQAAKPGQSGAGRPGSQSGAGRAGQGNTPPASNAPDGTGRPGPSLSEAAQTVAAGVSSIRSRIRGLADWDSAPHAPNPPRPAGDGPAYARPAPGAASADAAGAPGAASTAASGPASYSYDPANGGPAERGPAAYAYNSDPATGDAAYSCDSAANAAAPGTPAYAYGSDPASVAADAADAAENAGRRKLLWLFLAILLCPVWIGLLGGLLGLIAGAFGVLIGLVATGVGGFIAAIAGLGSAIGLLVASPANGLVALSGCLLAAGIGILCLGLGVFCIGLLPKAIRALVRLVRRLFQSHRDRGGDEA